MYIFGDIKYDMSTDNIRHDPCNVYDLKNSVHCPASFKDENRTLLDVFLTKKSTSSCNCISIYTAITHLNNLTGIIPMVHAPESNRCLITEHILIIKSLPNNSATFLFMFVIFLMMLMILHGPNNILLYSDYINIHAHLKQRYHIPKEFHPFHIFQRKRIQGLSRQFSSLKLWSFSEVMI